MSEKSTLLKEYAILGIHARLNDLDRERALLMETRQQIEAIDVKTVTKRAPQVRTVRTVRARNGSAQSEAAVAAQQKRRTEGQKKYWADMTPKQRAKEVNRRLGRD